jgi:hypothetical protein
MAAESAQRVFSTSSRIRCWVAFGFKEAGWFGLKEGDPVRPGVMRAVNDSSEAGDSVLEM